MLLYMLIIIMLVLRDRDNYGEEVGMYGLWILCMMLGLGEGWKRWNGGG